MKPQPLILVVDDDCELCESLREFLSHRGYPVHCARHGDDALQWLAHAHLLPALILLDVEMPVLDGWQFMDERLKTPRFAAIPVAMFSGCGDDLTEQAAQAGVAAFLRKPVDPLLLLNTIRRLTQEDEYTSAGRSG